jgi:hypothetical protein
MALQNTQGAVGGREMINEKATSKTLQNRTRMGLAQDEMRKYIEVLVVEREENYTRN